MNAAHSVLESIWDFLRTPPVQSALIAAVVSFIVAGLTNRRERRARRAQRAERLLREVYGPIETCLKNNCLYECVQQCRDTLEKNRYEFPKNILVFIDQALGAYVSPPMNFSKDDTDRLQEAKKQLRGIADKLLPLMNAEKDRLKKLL